MVIWELVEFRADEGGVKVAVEEEVGATGLGENDAVAPLGNPEAANWSV
jgi:hypothetical protein